MTVTVQFYSYFKELAGCDETAMDLPEGSTVAELHERVMAVCPKLASMRKSTLIAVGLDYQLRSYALQDGQVVSLFPPVQGG
jgi:molybdopterin converting factor small subunit